MIWMGDIWVVNLRCWFLGLGILGSWDLLSFLILSCLGWVGGGIENKDRGIRNKEGGKEGKKEGKEG